MYVEHICCYKLFKNGNSRRQGWLLHLLYRKLGYIVICLCVSLKILVCGRFSDNLILCPGIIFHILMRCFFNAAVFVFFGKDPQQESTIDKVSRKTLLIAPFFYAPGDENVTILSIPLSILILTNAIIDVSPGF